MFRTITSLIVLLALSSASVAADPDISRRPCQHLTDGSAWDWDSVGVGCRHP
jgi:hypothetical protein